MSDKCYLFVSLLIVWALVAPGQEIKINGGFIEDSLQLGNTVHYWVTAEYPKEIELLFYLIKNKNIVISKTEILEDVWENHFPQEEEHNLVEVYIGYLRKKLKPHNLDQKISTVRGYGYRWDDE